ncbi:glycosyltransferase family A protein [Synechococcus sp. LTW-G]
MISYDDAQAISSALFQRHKKFIRQDFRAISKEIDAPLITVAIPNYNNVEILPRVLESLERQQGVRLSVVLLDNCSSDGSWEFIEDYQYTHSNFNAVRTRSNLGPHTTGNILSKSSFTEYMLYASGNDLIADDLAVLKLYLFLESHKGYDLAYGRNVKDGLFSEPEVFCLSAPDKKERMRMGLSDVDSMDIVNWLYTSNEPLWGLYRTDACKSLVNSFGYGSDHVSTTSMAYFGGIAGLDFACREVEAKLKDMDELRVEQVQVLYGSTNGESGYPLDMTNMCSLAKSYFIGLSKLQIDPETKILAVENAVTIVILRFFDIILCEARTVSDKLRCSSLDSSDLLDRYRRLKDDYFYGEVLIPLIKKTTLNL